MKNKFLYVFFKFEELWRTFFFFLFLNHVVTFKRLNHHPRLSPNKCYERFPFCYIFLFIAVRHFFISFKSFLNISFSSIFLSMLNIYFMSYVLWVFIIDFFQRKSRTHIKGLWSRVWENLDFSSTFISTLNFFWFLLLIRQFHVWRDQFL